jgi:hypothetical protein
MSTTVNILSCAGWLPHFRWFVWGCPCLPSGVNWSWPLKVIEDSPPEPCLQLCTTDRYFDFPAFLRVCSSSIV